MASNRENRSRDEAEFSKRTRRTIKEMAGGLCSDPNCLRFTSDAFGEACHIYSAAPTGPRGHGSLETEALKHQSNGIWLCRNHHGMTDHRQAPLDAKVLLEWKAVREASCLASLRNDIAIIYSELGPKDLDKIIRDQYREQLNGENVFELDYERVAREGMSLICQKKFIRDGPTTLSSHKLPQEFKQTPIAAEVCMLETSGAFRTSPIMLFGSDIEIDHFSESLNAVACPEFAASELVAVSEVIQSWCEFSPNDCKVGIPCINIQNITYVLAPSKGGIVDLEALVRVYSRVRFLSGHSGIQSRPDAEIMHSGSPLEWKFSTFQRKSGRITNSRFILKGYTRFKQSGEINSNDCYKVESQERLLVSLHSGADMVGFLCTQFGYYFDKNSLEFHQTPLPISLDGIQRDCLEKAIWQARRIMFLYKLSVNWLGWHFTEICLDPLLTDDLINKSIEQLKKEQAFSRTGRAQVRTPLSDGRLIKIACTLAKFEIILERR
ncbi:hypothetical protein [Acidovorax sp. NCPPB 3576]|uniref:hypothetical protein n=1 Tax=Acidovorax sp. NCPPB 3576 TaxID=2940488 RepID=UPI00234920C4|nr:hypothetical protein [Acidovorax sp. NCPPB 3576]WCM90564.1 hypothetical protein M5C98_11330 [Acidovorax sp. NCPPB 3576]